MAELISATLSGSNQFTSWLIYVNLLMFLLGLFFWLNRMNRALQKFDALVRFLSLAHLPCSARSFEMIFQQHILEICKAILSLPKCNLLYSIYSLCLV